jgi:hypothetical protein
MAASSSTRLWLAHQEDRKARIWGANLNRQLRHIARAVTGVAQCDAIDVTIGRQQTFARPSDLSIFL